MTRVAAIDCGTNSIRLLVADIDPVGRTLVDVVRRMEIVRLGEGVDQTGRLSEAALARTFSACEDYADVIESLAVERTRFVATSATRDAANRDVFVCGVRDRLGVWPEVVTGDEEAALAFTGATRALAGESGAGPYLVLDIGGGSTEFVLGVHQPTAARSVDMGCVRLTERHLRSDPPTSDQVAAARGDIEALIDWAAEVVPLADAVAVVGLAGSVTTVAAIALGLTEYDADALHGVRLATADIHTVTDRLLSMTHDQRAAIPVMHPGRVDVIAGGALVLDGIVSRMETLIGLQSITVSEHDILDGIAWSSAEV